ncbi:ATP-binding protein [Amycolatopsis balhimycina DSM 5908]|uniref:ATP-binding protein n=1 Tax=Amycolatopsis balhimycina DSM 5908 TaxID=1081091 RepID=A0A428WZV2_AMYBA|nr:ATP-binding protein [Amycolatopsis balhimycina]RSM48623.1 ATP-binding protein [Amycolatopsis balhimycina DSM 5908]
MHGFEQTPLWRHTLAPQSTDDPEREPREHLRSAYLQFRSTVEPLAAEISRSMPMFTDHSITHVDALWDTASLICGESFPLNAAEAFVLGGAFLLHDLGMGLASYSGGLTAIENDPQFDDLMASALARLRRTDPSARGAALERSAREQTVADLLRLRHAEQAERLVATTFTTSDGEGFYLLQDVVLRQTFGSMIGRIAHSHWFDVSDLRAFEQPQGSCIDHPTSWEVDPLKIACVLRLADAAHVDQRRASPYLHAFRKPTGTSHDHWYFQERLTRPRVQADRLVYTATRPFGRDEAAAWWLAYEVIRTIDNELRRVDALCADLDRPRFAVRSVAGADSPARLALYIRTDLWEPLDARLRVSDATQLIANLGGKDLYGNKPEVAIRELVANAADATRARRVHEGDYGGAATIRLSSEDGEWWLTVEDHGIGMAPETMVTALTDFGHSRWLASDMLNDFPGLLGKGFQPTGRFGIGFFAVFMIADQVEVRSLGYDEAPRSTHVLEFRHGVTGRPMLRQADFHERLRNSGTLVRLKLREAPRTEEGLFQTTNRRLSETELLHSRMTRLCALSDVDIKVQGPDDSQPVRIIQADDWRRISRSELFRRVYRREEASHLDRVVYDGYEKVFIDRARDLHDPDGNLIGRAMMASGWEIIHPDLRWMQPPEASIYVGGLYADEIKFCMGVFCGYPLTADRLRAFPLADSAEFRRWLEAQADSVGEGKWSDPVDLWYAGYLARGLDASAPRLPCAQSTRGQLNAHELREWLQGRGEVLLVAGASVNWFGQAGRSTQFFTFEGIGVEIPDHALIVGLNPAWFYPEEVRPRPRDERFVDAVEPPSGWDARTWWYDTGNFGSVGLVVRTIAELWEIDIVEAVNLMEPLAMQDDCDHRPLLETADGAGLHVTAIRMRRPGTDDIGESR